MKKQDNIPLPVAIAISCQIMIIGVYVLSSMFSHITMQKFLTADELVELQSFVHAKDWQSCNITLTDSSSFDQLRRLSMASINEGLDGLRKMDAVAIKDKWDSCSTNLTLKKQINDQINMLDQ